MAHQALPLKVKSYSDMVLGFKSWDIGYKIHYAYKIVHGWSNEMQSKDKTQHQKWTEYFTKCKGTQHMHHIPYLFLIGNNTFCNFQDNT